MPSRDKAVLGVKIGPLSPAVAAAAGFIGRNGADEIITKLRDPRHGGDKGTPYLSPENTAIGIMPVRQAGALKGPLQTE